MKQNLSRLLRLASVVLLLLSLNIAGRSNSPARTAGMAAVNGTRLYYETAGKGSPLVFIHGGLVDSRLWDEPFKEFAKRYRVVRYDLRGFGTSAAAPEPFSHIEDLAALLNFLKIERATLVGLSLGGIIAADFALEHPQRVERLVLVGPGLRGDRQPPDQQSQAAWGAVSEGAEAFVKAMMQTSLYAAVPAGTPAHTRLRQIMLDNFKSVPTLRAGFLKYPEPPTIERLGQLPAPTLVIIGSKDAPALQNIADTLQRGIPGARKVVIEDASHHPPVEKPKEFNQVLLAFISGR